MQLSNCNICVRNGQKRRREERACQKETSNRGRSVHNKICSVHIIMGWVSTQTKSFNSALDASPPKKRTIPVGEARVLAKAQKGIFPMAPGEGFWVFRARHLQGGQDTEGRDRRRRGPATCQKGGGARAKAQRGRVHRAAACAGGQGTEGGSIGVEGQSPVQGDKGQGTEGGGVHRRRGRSPVQGGQGMEGRGTCNGPDSEEGQPPLCCPTPRM